MIVYAFPLNVYVFVMALFDVINFT